MGRSLPNRTDGDPTDRHAAAVNALRRAVFESRGSTEPSVRDAAASGGQLPEPLGSYAAKVRDQSYRITDNDFAGLTAAGLSDDAIVEITIAASVGAALQRLDTGMRMVRGSG
jgi:alkylhydroperoxidase family enzyme